MSRAGTARFGPAWAHRRLPAIARIGAVTVAMVSIVTVVLLGIAAATPGTMPRAAAFSREGLPVEYLDVYSPAMGRNVRVQFQGAGPAESVQTGSTKAVYLLDGLRARDDYSGWDINTAAFEWFYGSGVAVVMPVGGESSFYTDWYSPSTFNRQTYTYKWETFLTRELPAFLETARQVSPTGNGVVGVSMSGGAALTLSAYHPAQFIYAASLSGILDPSSAAMRQAIRVAMLHAGGYNVDNMWGPPWDPAWQRNDPVEQAALIAANGTRLWIHCGPDGQAPLGANTDPARALGAAGLESLALVGNRRFQQLYLAAGGSSATFVFPPAGDHSWTQWGAQLQALNDDLAKTLNG